MKKEKNIKLTRKKEILLRGVPLSGGRARGLVCLFNDKRHSRVPEYRIRAEEITREKRRFLDAVESVEKQLVRVMREVRQKVGQAEAGIFLAQKVILLDPALRARVTAEIRGRRINAEAAVVAALDFFEAQLLEIDHGYIKERTSDIGEIKRRILGALFDLDPSFVCAGREGCRRGRGRIVIAEELTPSLTMDIYRDQILGFVTEKGGNGSHAAILARSLGIPAVSGIPRIYDMISCGTEVLVDGDLGEVVVWPNVKTRVPQRKVAGKRAAPEGSMPLPGVKVLANINLAADAKEALDCHAEGIGLYRTELEFFNAGRLLTEAEQQGRYEEVLRITAGRDVYFRLLDIGGDKTAPFFDLPEEKNPYLGFRGSRFLIARKELFRTQARALAKTSAGGLVHVMYPMVVGLDQFTELKNIFSAETEDIPARNIKHGVMFEVPSACLEAEALMEAADFASIGTNDLIQYFFSVDRNNDFVAYDYNPDRPVFWDLLGRLALAAARFGKPLSLCGEMAENPDFVVKLIRAGISSVSVSPRSIPRLRAVLKDRLPGLQIDIYRASF